jgi:hypothetical protein
MKELDQNYINYISLINLIAVLGIIFFFYRKWKEMTEREEAREKRLATLEKSLIDSNNHVKTVLTRFNKKISGNQTYNNPPPIQGEEIRTEDRDELDEALAQLMA